MFTESPEGLRRLGRLDLLPLASSDDCWNIHGQREKPPEMGGAGKKIPVGNLQVGGRYCVFHAL